MKILFTTRFRRSYKRLVARSEKLCMLVAERMMFFEKNPKNPILKDHSLQGKFNAYRAFSIGYDLRIIYRKERAVTIFFDIGTHDQVYY